MAKFNDKISTLINAQLPEFVVEQHPKFASFLKSYYQLLESAELQVEQIETTDGILLETETNQENLLILDAGRLGSTRTQLDSGDKVLTEDTAFGKFQNSETITGATSGATAVIVAEDLDNTRLYFYKNDTLVNSGGIDYSVGTAVDGSTSETTYYFAAGSSDGGTNPVLQANFGGSSGFAISSGNADPDGYGNFEFATKGGYALCTKNLAEYG